MFTDICVRPSGPNDYFIYIYMYVCMYVYIYNIHSPWGYVEPVAAGYWGFGVSAFDLRGARVPRSNLGAGKFHQGCCFFLGGVDYTIVIIRSTKLV